MTRTEFTPRAGIRCAFVLRWVLYIATARLFIDVLWLLGRSWYLGEGLGSFAIAWASLAAAFLGGSTIVWSGARTRRMTGCFCPQCVYDLTGLPSTVCPECGTDFVARRVALVKGHARRKRALGCGVLAASIVCAAMLSQIHVYYDPTYEYVFVVEPTRFDARAAARMGDVRVGMSRTEVGAILGPPTGGWAGTLVTGSSTAFEELTLYYGVLPTHYMVGPLRPTERTTYHAIWESGPSVHLGADGRVETKQVGASVRDHLIQIW